MASPFSEALQLSGVSSNTMVVIYLMVAFLFLIVIILAFYINNELQKKAKRLTSRKEVTTKRKTLGF